MNTFAGSFFTILSITGIVESRFALTRVGTTNVDTISISVTIVQIGVRAFVDVWWENHVILTVFSK